MKLKPATAVLTVLATICINPSANATLIAFEFSGSIVGSKYVDGPNAGTVFAGAPANGTAIFGAYIFDPSVLDTDPSPIYGTYQNAIKNFSTAIGNLEYRFELTTGGFSRIDTEDGTGGVVRDRYSAFVEKSGGVGVTGPALGVFLPTFFQLSVFDFEGGTNPNLLVSDSLPTAPPQLAFVTDYFGLGSSEVKRLTFQFEDSLGVRVQVLGELNSIKLTQIPEPTTLALMALGLAGIERSMRRRKQSGLR